jgi:hypothetical protein
MKIKLIVIFLISFITISSQNMLNYEVDLPEVKLNLAKPQNKVSTRNSINERVIVFISGVTLTTFSTVQILRSRNSNFRFDNPNVTIPIGPHGMLFGVGLFAMSFSFVIS